MLASARKDRASFTQVSWVACHIRCSLASLARSMMACQTFLARDWYTFAAFDSSLRIHYSAIFSLALTLSYTYLVPSAKV